MKKLSVIALLAFFSLAGFAQQGEKSALVNLGYKTKVKMVGIGVEGRYFFTDNIRFAPDVTIFLPKNHTIGMDINANAHYVFPIQDGLSVYPLAGISMQNGHFSYQGESSSSTNFGLNLGVGADYALSDNSFVNAELKYIVSDGDCAVIKVGYGIKF